MSVTTPNTLYTALLNAQRAMGPVKKDASNPAFRTKYATLWSVLETIEQPLWDNGLIIVQRFANDEGGPVLITELIHAESGQAISSYVPVVCKDPLDPQKVGGAITYYRRYSLLALLGLAPEDDDGNTAAKPAPARQNAPSAEQRYQTARATGTDPATNDAPLWGEIERARQHEPSGGASASALYLEIVRNDEAGRLVRLDALDQYYALASDFADFTERASFVKASGLPVEDRKAAYEKHQRRLAERSPAPIAASAG